MVVPVRAELQFQQVQHNERQALVPARSLARWAARRPGERRRPACGTAVKKQQVARAVRWALAAASPQCSASAPGVGEEQRRRRPWPSFQRQPARGHDGQALGAARSRVCWAARRRGARWRLASGRAVKKQQAGRAFPEAAHRRRSALLLQTTAGPQSAGATRTRSDRRRRYRQRTAGPTRELPAARKPPTATQPLQRL